MTQYSKKKIIFLGKLPPPYIGPANATKVILNSKISDRYQLIHLDTSDHRDAKTLGKIDLVNIFVAIKQYLILIKLLLTNRKVKAVYIPSQQTTIGYMRDIPFFLITKFFGKKLICHLRGGYFRKFYESSSFFTKSIVKTFQPLVDCQIVLGESLTYMFEGLMPEEKIFVVPNGANYPIPDKKRRSNTVRILYLSNFLEEKGILDVLKAGLILSERGYDFELYCVGSYTKDYMKSEIKNVLKNYNGNEITIHNPVSGLEKFQMLSDSDVFVLPTYYRYEGHPWAIVEAMAFSLPVISTDHAAISETVFDQQNGFLVEKKNPAEIAEKVGLLIENTQLRTSMSKKSREIYERNFTEDIMIEKLSYAIKQTIDQKIYLVDNL